MSNGLSLGPDGWRRLASRASVALRRDREVRCDAGAAPATVSGEIATRKPLAAGCRREGAAIDDPEPGDLLVAPLFCDHPRAEERLAASSRSLATSRLDRSLAAIDAGAGRRALGQEPLRRGADRRGRARSALPRDRRGA